MAVTLSFGRREGLGLSQTMLFDSLLVVPNHVIRFIARQADCRSVCGVELGQNRQRRLRDGISVALDAKGYASRISERASATYLSKEVAHGHSEVAVINLSDAR